MPGYYVYILKCSDKSYYTGVTNDPERRLIEHNSGYHSESYTMSRRPVEMVYYQAFDNILDAISFEKQVKGWSRRKKEAIIDGNWHKLPELSKSKSFSKSSNE